MSRCYTQITLADRRRLHHLVAAKVPVYPLGTRYRIAHGIANALIFPHVFAVNASAVPEKTEMICRAMGFDAS
ncbi:alcohol dehydrogenase class IV [Pseudorhizobium tarimense]|uniref:Alcohol dehydrogenase class IV n=1 Tax=Pseudorhizobium tarimense TaxID=1079109 RepID=A0ABV2HE84_9HYPH